MSETVSNRWGDAAGSMGDLGDWICPRANALGMDIVKIGRFAQILGRKASKKSPVKRGNLPIF